MWMLIGIDIYSFYGIKHSVLRGAAIVFFAFLGFDAISTAAQETKNPRRNMPIGILGSLLICTLLSTFSFGRQGQKKST
jgi:amino acid transporter